VAGPRLLGVVDLGYRVNCPAKEELRRHVFPVDASWLISLCLEIGRDTWKLARMLYMAGGDST
jgi:hypothetical protein